MRAIWPGLSHRDLPLKMSVLFETSLGDIVIDLETEACPRTCKNFLKLCKVYYYNLNAFFNGVCLSIIRTAIRLNICN